MESVLTKILVVSSFLLAVEMTACSWGAAEDGHKQIAREGCQDECGGVKIPFPFGIGQGCYSTEYDNTYRIFCDNTSSSTNPKPLLPILGNKEVLGINLQDHTLRLSWGAAYDCHPTGDSVPSAAPNSSYGAFDNLWMPMMLSTSRNNFVAIGCGITASLGEVGLGDDYDSARCTTSCNDQFLVPRNGLCDPIVGCCELPIITNMTTPFISVGRSSNRTQKDPSLSHPCSYAFVAEVGSYNFSATNLTATAKDCYDVRVPLVYDWFFYSYGTFDSCSEDKTIGYDSLAIRCSSNSMIECDENYERYHLLYTCQCLEGYSGNQYLPNGCQDINECVDEEMNNCERQEYCVNKEGGYDCRCPKGHLGNATTASPCIRVPSDAKLILGICIAGMGSMICFITLYAMYKLIKRRKGIKERKHNFKKNGGLLLNQELSTSEGVIDKTKIFSRSELEKATNNFNENRVLGHGGQGTVYKGMLEDGTIIAVKKSKKVSENQLAQFINEVVILSQINHRNIVKLFGCCLETEVPLLVYEYVPNGTLFQHIHHPVEDFKMTWKVRFQIAIDCAGAVAYLHSSCSSPIYHRDIKSSNILLDGKYKAKISDFGTSRSISIDKTHVTTCVQGTFGYLDPEFFRSSQFNEKSDVYSFGVVLLELMTSKKPIFTNTSREPRGLATDFVQLMETSPHQLNDILDTQVLQQCPEEEIEALTKLIERCLCLYGKKRPTMREVTMTLEMIKSQHDKEGNPANARAITREEGDVWNDNSDITNKDIYVDTSSYDDNSYSMDIHPALVI